MKAERHHVSNMAVPPEVSIGRMEVVVRHNTIQ